jgi:hypothetical protein
MTDYTRLDAEFSNGEVLTFEGRGGRTFEYIEDETVMDRLDEVLGKGEWSIDVEPISVADGIVKVTLHAFGRTYADFGYQTRDGGEALKEAVSDGIRRCGRYLGVGRYLYRKHETPSRGGRAAPSPARPSAPPRTSTQLPEEPDDLAEAFAAPTPIRNSDNGECPEHGVTWNGQWGDLWHKGPDGYCRHPDNVKQDRKAARR